MQRRQLRRLLLEVWDPNPDESLVVCAKREIMRRVGSYSELVCTSAVVCGKTTRPVGSYPEFVCLSGGAAEGIKGNQIGGRDPNRQQSMTCGKRD